MNGNPLLSGREVEVFCRWFDETWQCLAEMASNPFPHLLSLPTFNPRFTVFGLYKCCDPVNSARTSSMMISKGGLKTVADDLDTCASLTRKLNAKLSKLEASQINTRLLPTLRARATSEYSQITREGIAQLREVLSDWQKTFSGAAKVMSSIASERAFNPNADLVIPLLCHLRLVAGKEAPGFLSRLLEAGYTGHGQKDKAVTSPALLNLEKRYRQRNQPTYLDRQALAIRNTQPLPGAERELWQRGDAALLKATFCKSSIRPIRTI